MGESDDLKNSFAHVLQEARGSAGFSLQIHWCCWAAIAEGRRLDRRYFKRITPGQEYRESEPSLRKLMGPNWEEAKFRLLEPLMTQSLPPEEPIGKLKNLRLGADNLRTERDQRASRTAVGDVEIAFSAEPEALRFYTNTGSADLVAGVWQGKDDESYWQPEISVCRKYSDTDLGSVQHLTDLLSRFLEKMAQDSIFLRLSAGNVDNGWLFVRCGSSYIYINKGPLRCWQLRCNVNGKSTAWTHQTLHLLELLKESDLEAWDSALRDGVSPATIDEYVIQPEMNDSGEDKGLGATFTAGDGDALHVLRSGSPRFLFEPFFWPWVPPEQELPPRRAVPILLASEMLGVKRVLEYTIYNSDPQQGRCLCGKQYPLHPTKECPQIAALRNMNAAWIRSRYVEDPSSRGTQWSWGKLSSPYFYLCEDPDSLLDDPAGTKDLEARKKAREKWREIMNEIYR